MIYVIPLGLTISVLSLLYLLVLGKYIHYVCVHIILLRILNTANVAKKYFTLVCSRHSHQIMSGMLLKTEGINQMV